jgi:hypothetical protein
LLGFLLSTEVLKNNAELFIVLLEDTLSNFEVFVIVNSLGLVLGGERHKLMLEKVLKLVGESREFRIVCVFNGSSSDQSFEELTLQNDFSSVVNIFSGDSVSSTLVLVFF